MTSKCQKVDAIVWSDKPTERYYSGWSRATGKRILKVPYDLCDGFGNMKGKSVEIELNPEFKVLSVTLLPEQCHRTRLIRNEYIEINTTFTHHAKTPFNLFNVYHSPYFGLICDPKRVIPHPVKGDTFQGWITKFYANDFEGSWRIAVQDRLEPIDLSRNVPSEELIAQVGLVVGSRRHPDEPLSYLAWSPPQTVMVIHSNFCTGWNDLLGKWVQCFIDEKSRAQRPVKVLEDKFKTKVVGKNSVQVFAEFRQSSTPKFNDGVEIFHNAYLGHIKDDLCVLENVDQQSVYRGWLEYKKSERMGARWQIAVNQTVQVVKIEEDKFERSRGDETPDDRRMRYNGSVSVHANSSYARSRSPDQYRHENMEFSRNSAEQSTERRQSPSSYQYQPVENQNGLSREAYVSGDHGRHDLTIPMDRNSYQNTEAFNSPSNWRGDKDRHKMPPPPRHPSPMYPDSSPPNGQYASGNLGRQESEILSETDRIRYAYSEFPKTPSDCHGDIDRFEMSPPHRHQSSVYLNSSSPNWQHVSGDYGRQESEFLSPTDRNRYANTDVPKTLSDWHGNNRCEMSLPHRHQSSMFPDSGSPKGQYVSGEDGRQESELATSMDRYRYSNTAIPMSSSNQRNDKDRYEMSLPPQHQSSMYLDSSSPRRQYVSGDYGRHDSTNPRDRNRYPNMSTHPILPNGDRKVESQNPVRYGFAHPEQPNNSASEVQNRAVSHKKSPERRGNVVREAIQKPPRCEPTKEEAEMELFQTKFKKMCQLVKFFNNDERVQHFMKCANKAKFNELMELTGQKTSP